MKNVDRILGRVVAQARKKAGVSQEQLAFQCGLHRTYISQIERGLKSPTARTLFDLASALDVRPSELLRNVEDASK